MTDLRADTAAAVDALAVSDHDPRHAAIQAAAGNEVLTFVDADALAGTAVWTVLNWLATDECDDELAAELLRRGEVGDDLTQARTAVRLVLDVLHDRLTGEFPCPW